MSMNLQFTRFAVKHLKKLQQESKAPKKLWELLLDIHINGHEGIGHPEPLKGNLSGWWSRKIDGEHRLVYQIEDEQLIIIAQCYGHYGDK